MKKFQFSTMLQTIHALSPRSQNLAARTVSTSALASWTNRTTNEVIGESVKKNDALILNQAALQGCESLKLIEALEAEEGAMVQAAPLATLPTEKAFIIHSIAFILAKDTSQVGNRYEQPMTLAQWLKFLITNTQRDNAAALEQFAEVSGYNIKDVQYMDAQSRKMELERLDKAIPALIDQYKIDLTQLGKSDDVELDIFNYFKLLLKIQIKLEKEAMGATNRALRFTNLAFLEDAREYRADAQAMQDVITQFEQEHEKELALWASQIEAVRLAA